MFRLSVKQDYPDLCGLWLEAFGEDFSGICHIRYASFLSYCCLKASAAISIFMSWRKNARWFAWLARCLAPSREKKEFTFTELPQKNLTVEKV